MNKLNPTYRLKNHIAVNLNGSPQSGRNKNVDRKKLSEKTVLGTKLNMVDNITTTTRLTKIK